MREFAGRTTASRRLPAKVARTCPRERRVPQNIGKDASEVDVACLIHGERFGSCRRA